MEEETNKRFFFLVLEKAMSFQQDRENVNPPLYDGLIDPSPLSSALTHTKKYHISLFLGNKEPYYKRHTYLDGVCIPVAALAQVRRSERDARLDGFRLAREVAQVDLSLWE